MRLLGKVAVITGAASGIGNEIAPVFEKSRSGMAMAAGFVQLSSFDVFDITYYLHRRMQHLRRAVLIAMTLPAASEAL